MECLIEHLKSFNSKERFWLICQALGVTAFYPSDNFLKELGSKLNLRISRPVFVAMDYHLDWLYASLCIWGNQSKQVFLNDNKIIRAQQEDVDLLIAYKENEKYHIVLVEAKGITGWSNKQLQSKAIRLKEIFNDFDSEKTGVFPHFIIISPSEPHKLDINDTWPYWMAPSGKVAWLKLQIPSLLNCVTRCDNFGKQNKAGKYWTKITR